MFDWLTKLNWKKIALAALVFAVISFVIRQVEAMTTLSFYMDPAYFGVWSKLMTPDAGPPPPQFMFVGGALTYFSGLVLATFYDFVKSLLPKDFWGRVVSFTTIVSVLSLIFGYLLMYMLFNVPAMLLIIWFLVGILITALATMAFTKILK